MNLPGYAGEPLEKFFAGVYSWDVNIPGVFYGRRLACVLTALLLFGTLASLTAQTKQIRLRNQVLTNAPSPSGPTLQVVAPAADGLYLIQFTGPVEPAWRSQLSALHATLIRYVPEDTFIARLEDASLSVIRSLDFVHWVGEYKPAYRVHQDVYEQLQSPSRSNALSLRMMISPVATVRERLELQRLFSAFRGTSRSRFGDVMHADISPAQLTSVLQSDAVLWVEGPANMQMSDEVSTKIVLGGIVSPFNNDHLADIHNLGFNGTGVTVAVADSGLDRGVPIPMHPDLAGRTTAFFYYGDLFDASDEHAHGTHVTGIIAGSGAGLEEDENGALYGLGMAPNVEIVTQRIFDGIGLYQPPDSFEQLTSDAVDAGADIGSNSWGDNTQGRYDLSAAEFDALVRDADFETPGDQQYILEFSAGNAGPLSGSINSPAVAKNVIATGASLNDRDQLFIYTEGRNTMADFSSRGPCEDGRIKPDIVAPGTWISSAQTSATGDQNSWLGISALYQYQGGTSQAGPHVSGAAALFVQYYRQMFINTPSPALVKAALINSADDMDDSFGTLATPNMEEGWGRLNLVNLLDSFRRYDYLDQDVLLQTSQAHEQSVIVAADGEPLIVTLTYTDVPGVPAAIPALVNDLDLEVLSPDGRVYRGNQFDFFGLSIPDAVDRDNINNVEGVYIDFPTPGEWTIRVAGRRIVEDARIDTIEVDQDFALVVSGNLPLPGTSTIFLDQSAYRAPDTANVKVFDADARDQSSVPVTVSGSSDAPSFTLNLNASAPGAFTGSVELAELPAVPDDGILQIGDGDQIVVTYFDVSANRARSASARGDFTPPVLTNISVTNRLGRVFITWNVSERANGVVNYGTSVPPQQTGQNLLYETSHSIELANVIPGETYFVSITSTDIAGNSTTQNNNGNYIQFIAPTPPTVLVVDAYEPNVETSATDIPISEYTTPLANAGIDYAVWDKETLGQPLLPDLRPFEVVIWRINDSFWNAGDIINGVEQTTITQYLNQGGSFLLTSMELISRLGDVPFRRNVMKVARFDLNPDPFGEACADCDEDVGVPAIFGEDYDIIGDGIAASLDYSDYPFLDVITFQIGPDLGDTFGPTTDASPIITAPNGKVSGIRYPKTGQDSNGRIVFLSIPLDTIPMDGTASGRTAILKRIIQFLAPGLNGEATIALDKTAYTTPSLVTIEVADRDFEGAGTLDVTVLTTTSSAGTTVTLRETSLKGLFRGTAKLVSPGGVTGPGELAAVHGDSVVARFDDLSEGATRIARADVDTIPPEITNLAVDPFYTESQISWDLSEPGDGEVQYSEAPIFQGQIQRTVSDPYYELSHSLFLDGLRHDQTYYYKVVSRDIAGNVAEKIMNDQGQPLTFATLQPLEAPWSDDMEFPGLYDWDVFTPDYSDTSWMQGVPSSQSGGAHSPETAWGSNLQRRAMGVTETFLIGPPVLLSEGNRATLQFWQNYDFIPQSDQDLLEFGILLLFTNSISEPVVLHEYFDSASFGWEPQEYDLSPFIGQIVQPVWHYGYATIQNTARLGWLIDDVSILTETIDPATLIVTNNIAQATFNISGPISRSAHPWYFNDTNAPPGEYTVSFNAVPYYQTPATRVEELAAGEVLSISGNYTFTDSNANGISDVWEQQYLGAVDMGYDGTVDSDGDGISDSGEFQSGTNPTNSASKLELNFPSVNPTNNALTVTWPMVPGFAYKLDGSQNALDWSTLVDWTRARSNMFIYQTAVPQDDAALFRLQVKP